MGEETRCHVCVVIILYLLPLRDVSSDMFFESFKLTMFPRLHSLDYGPGTNPPLVKEVKKDVAHGMFVMSYMKLMAEHVSSLWKLLDLVA